MSEFTATHLRIQFIGGRARLGELFQDTAVVPISEIGYSQNAAQAIPYAMHHGVYRPNRYQDGKQITFYDPSELICPGAILSITPCDERGYSEYDYMVVVLSIAKPNC